MKEPEPQDQMAEATAIRDAPEGECLRADEIGSAFDGLSRDDKLKLGVIEARLLSGTGLGKGDLVHEAVCLALTGVRNCPRHVSFTAFLVMTMKSIASHARHKHSREVASDDPLAAASAEFDVALAPSPEDTLDTASVLRKIFAHFESDQEATLVLMGWAEGLRGEALREETGLDQPALDYAAKRIRAGARKLYSDGR